MIVEQFANPGPLVHFARVTNDIGIPAELTRKIPVFILIEPIPTTRRLLSRS